MTMIYEKYGFNNKETCIISPKINSDDRMINLVSLNNREFEVGKIYFEEYYRPTGQNLLENNEIRINT